MTDVKKIDHIPTRVKETLSVGEISKRSGLSISAIHFYESKNLISSIRNKSNHRRFKRDVLRRLAIIKVAKNLGLSLKTIENAFKKLPKNQTPTEKDWADLSLSWHNEINQRITQLIRLRDRLTGCIGCGCLSIENCRLINFNDYLGENKTGGVLLEKI